MGSKEEPQADLTSNLSAIVPADIELIRREASEGAGVVATAEAWEVVDKKSADDAADWRLDCDKRIKRIQDGIEKPKKAAHFLHRFFCDLENYATAPYETARGIFHKKIIKWQDDEAARLAREQRERDEEERRQEMARRERELKDRLDRMAADGLIEQDGEGLHITDAGVEALKNRDAYPMDSPERQVLEPLAKQKAEADEATRQAALRKEAAPAPTRVSQAELAQQTVHREPYVTSSGPAPSRPKVAGLDNRETWRAVLLDIDQLINAAHENPDAWRGLLMVDQAAADARARAEKGNCKIPGFKIVRDDGLAKSRGR